MAKILNLPGIVQCAECGETLLKEEAVHQRLIPGEIHDDDEPEELWYCPKCNEYLEEFAVFDSHPKPCICCGVKPSKDTTGGFIGRILFAYGTESGDDVTLTRLAWICNHCAEIAHPVE